jgi:hypothetical protein
VGFAGYLRKMDAEGGDLEGETWCYVWWLWPVNGHILMGEKYARF